MKITDFAAGLTTMKDNSQKRGRAGNDRPFIKFSRHSRAVFFSANLIRDTGVVYGTRVGFVYQQNTSGPVAKPWLLLVYFTTNQVGTREIKKYNTTGWKITDTDFVNMVYQRFNRINSKNDFRLYVKTAAAIRLEVNGSTEICFPVYEDIGNFPAHFTEQYKAEYNNFLLSLKDLK